MSVLQYYSHMPWYPGYNSSKNSAMFNTHISGRCHFFTLFFLQASKLTMIWTSIVCPGIFCPDLYTGAVYLTAALSVTFETERLIIAFRFMLDPSWLVYLQN